MELKEYILCAAIWLNDGKSHVHQPKNIKTGFVISGRRHHNCFATLAAIGNSLGIEERLKKKIIPEGREGQGFITNFDRYVNRKEGFYIAQKAGQLLHNIHDMSNPTLISEDLY